MSVSPRASNLDVEQLFNILNSQETSFQGSLKKKGRHGMQSWSDRYCVLKGPYLFYYSDPQKNELKGVVNLKNAVIQRNGLDITISGDQTRPYHLQASSAENHSQWVEYLNRAISDTKKKEDVHRELANAIKLRDTELKQLKETTKRQLEETIAELTRNNDRLKKELEAERAQSEGVKRQIDQLSDQIEQERNRSRSLEAELRNARGSDSKLEKLQNDLLQEQRRRQACETELKPLQIEVTELRDRLQRTMVQPREQQQDQLMIANLQRELHAIKQSLHSESENRAHAEQNIHEVQALCDKYRKEVTMLRLQIKQQAFTDLGKKVKERETEIINAESWWKPELISIR